MDPILQRDGRYLKYNLQNKQNVPKKNEALNYFQRMREKEVKIIL